MWTRMYDELFLMSVVAGALYLILKMFGKLTGKYFSAGWHYYSYLVICSFFLVPYRKLVPPLDPGFAVRVGGGGTEGASGGWTLPSIFPSAARQLSPAAVSDRQEIAAWVAHILPFLCLTGSIVFLGAALMQHFRLHRRIVQMDRLAGDETLYLVLSECKQKLGIKKDIPVYLWPNITTPFLYGWWKPRIVLPDMDFTPEQYRHVFLHELTHYKRRDPWAKSLLLLVNAIHWFNPLAYMVRRDLDRFCEWACDESVVKSMDAQEKRRYCELILHVLWMAADRQAKLYSAFSDRLKSLERRIEMILKNDGSKKKKSVRLLAAAMTLAMAFVGTAAAYAGNAAQPAAIAEKKPNTASGKEGGVVEWGPIPAVNGLGREDAAVVIAGNSGLVAMIPQGSLRNGLGSDDTVTLRESSGDPRYWSALPENGLNKPDPAIETANRTSSVPPSDTEPLARGNLNPGKGYTFDRQTMGKGSQVTIFATWTSPDSELLVGLLSLTTNTIYYDTLSGGAGSATLQVNTADEYAIYVGNPSPSAVQFDVSYIVN